MPGPWLPTACHGLRRPGLSVPLSALRWSFCHLSLSVRRGGPSVLRCPWAHVLGMLASWNVFPRCPWADPCWVLQLLSPPQRLHVLGLPSWAQSSLSQSGLCLVLPLGGGPRLKYALALRPTTYKAYLANTRIKDRVGTIRPPCDPGTDLILKPQRQQGSILTYGEQY